MIPNVDSPSGGFSRSSEIHTPDGWNILRAFGTVSTFGLVDRAGMLFGVIDGDPMDAAVLAAAPDLVACLTGLGLHRPAWTGDASNWAVSFDRDTRHARRFAVISAGSRTVARIETTEHWGRCIASAPSLLSVLHHHLAYTAANGGLQPRHARAVATCNALTLQ